MTVSPDNTADLHTVITTLRAERDAALAREAALAEVPGVINRSPSDTQQVFDLIAQHAAKLCEVPAVGVALFDGTMLYLAAQVGFDAAYAKAYAAQFPRRAAKDSAMGRAILSQTVVQIEDIDADLAYGIARPPGPWSALAVPLVHDGTPLGVIAVGRPATGPYPTSQVKLLQAFATQAVIAMENARLLGELRRRTDDLQESLEYQTATSDVLKVISRSTFDLQPVLDTLVETAAQLCEADQAAIAHRDGEVWRFAANCGFPPEYEAYYRELGAVSYDPDSPSVGARTALRGRPVHIQDVAAVPGYPETAVKLGKQRTSLGVPLLREGVPIGVLLLARQRVEPFTERQIALVSTFADQAVIAIENTRLLTEQREALQQQTATAEVLQIINASPGNLAPVFDAMLEKAHATCGADMGSLQVWDGTHVCALATLGYPVEVDAMLRRPFRPGPPQLALLAGDRLSHRTDATLVPNPDNIGEGFRERSGIRTNLHVPLRSDGVVVGFITANRREVRPFSEKEISLLENFAAQAVIAIENARLLNEVRQRQEELRITFENMGDGVAMFDDTHHLVAWNRKFQAIFDLPDALLEQHRTYEEHLRFLAARGDFGAGIDTAEQIHQLVADTGQPYGYERTRPDGRVIEVRRNPVPDGGFVLIFSDITERKRSEAEIRTARDAAEAAYRDLKAAQANLIQAEKMASLGQLTAGIAHEIKNPLNFVNNFAALSVDLLSELKETAAPAFAALTNDQRAEIEDVSAMLTSNLEKITEHGKRADGIVKAMLEHSRGSSAERRMVDLNGTIDEALNLAYHGARAQDQSFNITLERDFGKGIAPIEVNPQDMTRVFLNIFSNGFYAANSRARNSRDAGFVPTLKVTTRDADGAVEIRVRDNGTGIPAEIRDKLFQPFFTTKPTGEGTGLGLSITYDIITKQHGGTITVESEVDAFTEFAVTLPRQIFANDKVRA